MTNSKFYIQFHVQRRALQLAHSFRGNKEKSITENESKYENENESKEDAGGWLN